MAKPVRNSTHRILKAYNVDGQMRVEYVDGKYETINIVQTRFYFSDDNIDVCIEDTYFEVEYWSAVDTLESDTGPIGGVEDIVKYLSDFIGSINPSPNNKLNLALALNFNL